MALITDTLDTLSQAPLGHVASRLRLAVDPALATCKLGQTTRELATLIARAIADRTDPNAPSPSSTLDLDTDIMFSSWANQRCYDFDFGLGLGKPAFFGRPRMSAHVPSLMFLMPKRPDGSFVLTACLHEKDVVNLRQDPVFMEPAEVIG